MGLAIPISSWRALRSCNHGLFEPTVAGIDDHLFTTDPGSPRVWYPEQLLSAGKAEEDLTQGFFIDDQRCSSS